MSDKKCAKCGIDILIGHNIVITDHNMKTINESGSLCHDCFDFILAMKEIDSYLQWCWKHKKDPDTNIMWKILINKYEH